MAFTDPPYNVALGDHGGALPGAKRRRLQNDSLPAAQWQAFLGAWSKNLIAAVVGPIYVCMSTREWPALCAAMEASGGHWSDCLVWDKKQFVLGARDYQTQYECIWYGWPEGGSHYWCGARDQGNVISIQRPYRSEAHPTMKPLALIEHFIANSSRPGEVVADFFLGSGSTLIAAERTGRVCFGMEIDPHYASVVLARWEAFSGEKARKLAPAGPLS